LNRVHKSDDSLNSSLERIWSRNEPKQAFEREWKIDDFKVVIQTEFEATLRRREWISAILRPGLKLSHSLARMKFASLDKLRKIH
jgi:hypothetical protein